MISIPFQTEQSVGSNQDDQNFLKVIRVCILASIYLHYVQPTTLDLLSADINRLSRIYYTLKNSSHALLNNFNSKYSTNES